MASPAPHGGSLIVVDIASPRPRYGRLVAFPPPTHVAIRRGVPAARSLRRTCRHRPRHLQRAHRGRAEHATARALLAFFESLSRVTTLDELVQLVADTVPAVTGCDQSTVYLWDAESGQLVPRARTAGMEDPNAYQGPIVPVPGPGCPAGRRYRPSGENDHGMSVPTGPSGRPHRHLRPDPRTTEPLNVRTDIDVIERHDEPP